MRSAGGEKFMFVVVVVSLMRHSNSFTETVWKHVGSKTQALPLDKYSHPSSSLQNCDCRVRSNSHLRYESHFQTQRTCKRFLSDSQDAQTRPTLFSTVQSNQ